MARANDCTDADAKLAEYPCLNCESMRELLIILIALFAVEQDLQGDLDALLANSAKYRNLSDKEFLQLLIAGLPESWLVGVTEENLGQDFSCWKCLGDQDIKAIGVYLWCKYWDTPD